MTIFNLLCEGGIPIGWTSKRRKRKKKKEIDFLPIRSNRPWRKWRVTNHFRNENVCYLFNSIESMREFSCWLSHKRLFISQQFCFFSQFGDRKHQANMKLSSNRRSSESFSSLLTPIYSFVDWTWQTFNTFCLPMTKKRGQWRIFPLTLSLSFDSLDVECEMRNCLLIIYRCHQQRQYCDAIREEKRIG